VPAGELPQPVQSAQVFGHDRPKDLRVAAAVFVPQRVAQAVNFPPGDVGMSLFEFRGNVLGRFCNEQEAMFDGAFHGPARGKCRQLGVVGQCFDAGDLFPDIKQP
jgi:hypothetical protein